VADKEKVMGVTIEDHTIKRNQKAKNIKGKNNEVGAVDRTTRKNSCNREQGRGTKGQAKAKSKSAENRRKEKREIIFDPKAEQTADTETHEKRKEIT